MASSGTGPNSGLASALLNDVNDIENERGQRSFDIEEPLSPMFWMIAIVGLERVATYPIQDSQRA